MKTAVVISSFAFALVIASVGTDSAPEPFFEGLGSHKPAEQTASPDARQAILPVVTPMLAGEILYREGRRDDGLAKLREAVKAEDALRYSEPPDWILPARHSLGAALMQERRFAEAEQVYRDDLARLPENGWSLFGLAQSLHRQGREEEAAATDTRFQKIWSKADVQIKSSCLCQPGI